MISPVEAWTAERTGLGAELNPETLKLWQFARLREAVVRARGRGRFYAGRLGGLDVEALVSREALARLPFTRPADVAADPPAFLCVPPSEVARVTTLTTSGTSGVRKRVYFTRNDLWRTVDFFRHGMRTMTAAGQHVLILMPGESEDSIGRLLQTALADMGATASIGRPGWSIPETLEAARRADVIVGIPGEIIYLCRTDASLRPKNVLLSADYAPRAVIASLEETWRCRVLTHYGLTETGFGCAVQCLSREGHHLRDADLMIEIVDPETGRARPAGEAGEIVLTTLRHEAMPLIRYRTGDVARLEDRPCPCGSALPRLGRVEGRRENDILLAGGGTLSIHRLDEILFAIPEVRGFKAELRREGERDTLILSVEAAGRLDADSLAERLPGGLSLELRPAEVNPFASRAKRRLETSGEGHSR